MLFFAEFLHKDEHAQTSLATCIMTKWIIPDADQQTMISLTRKEAWLHIRYVGKKAMLLKDGPNQKGMLQEKPNNKFILGGQEKPLLLRIVTYK
ncbi:hypothetical protein DICVIV_07807 [Dictyocaulus viviparus]|uniref:Uncharacterized protein n=1 Tax=Dictyocaulus viviparus TaxID=29172 RepID=A0A0D8XQR8_DICVI|nr:hypothetical protein DICVIV_07807 [Dictyocaulus viviparus]